uniref:putative F-box protein PP2-B12 n=1 Tax=Erigeron canadensis TaxID=72917 RepID=UPI001CB90A7A|nr:putative F-box protein PP2-B12 [Erigeron canadensis]
MRTLEESAASISVLPEGCVLDILSRTSPADACRAAAVSKSFNSAAESNVIWDKFLPLDHHEIIVRAVSNVVFDSKKRLYSLLSYSYLLLDRGTLGFKLDKESGKKCYMLSARDLSIAWQNDTRYWEWGRIPESRFEEVGILREVWWLDIKGKMATAFLSPKTTYVAYLVFRISRRPIGLDVPAKSIVTFGGMRNETSNVYLQPPPVTTTQTQVSHTTRKDGWMEIVLGEFYCDDGDEGEVEMVFKEHHRWKSGLIVEGIEVRPK